MSIPPPISWLPNWSNPLDAYDWTAANNAGSDGTVLGFVDDGGLLHIGTPHTDGTHNFITSNHTWDLGQDYFSFRQLQFGQVVELGPDNYVGKSSVSLTNGAYTVYLNTWVIDSDPTHITCAVATHPYSTDLATFLLPASTPYFAFTNVDGTFEVLSSPDGTSWVSQYSDGSNPFVSSTAMTITFEIAVDPAPPSSFESVWSELNVHHPSGDWPVQIAGPLTENFVEPFNNLDQWTLAGSTGPDPTATGGVLSLHSILGESDDRQLNTTGFMTLTNSWFSIRATSVGSYPETIAGASLGGFGPLMLNGYPGHDGLTFSVGSALVTVPNGSTPTLLWYTTGNTVTFAYSLDEGATFVDVDTKDIRDLNRFGQVQFDAQSYPFGPASTNYDQTFDQVNLHGPVGGGPTRVDASSLVMEWDVPESTAWLRFSTRHVHQSVTDYLTSQLTSLHWLDPSLTPMGAAPVNIVQEIPQEWNPLENKAENATMIITVGEDPAATNEELGGSLASTGIPLFIDIFYNDASEALSLANDVRDIFYGRVPGSQRFLNVTDYSYAWKPDASGYQIEFEDIVRHPAQDNYTGRWQVVNVTCKLYFPEVIV